jgi:UDP-N-acetylmuramoyl-L-alanyl-D-glutamate--2,6-diaminopimelate ligase
VAIKNVVHNGKDMKLKNLIKSLPNLQIKRLKEIEISGVCSNSKLVAPGNLFIARKGRSDHGVNHIHEALAAGAVAIVSDIYDPTLRDITQIISPDVTALEGVLAARYYNFPASQLFTVGVTGTNGKTTISFMVKHLLDSLQLPCGLCGTIEYIVGQHRYRASHTTPDPCTLQKLMREMVLQGCQSVAMEVSSHALTQGRVDQVDFDMAIFTNLSPDHLDYHRTLEEYGNAKKRLFDNLNSTPKGVFPRGKQAIVNSDCPWHSELIKDCPVAHFHYGLSPSADLYADDLELSLQGSSFTVHCQGEHVRCFSPFVGRYNIYNYLSAMGVGILRGEPLAKVAAIMEQLPPVAGRLERIPNELGLTIYVDFAHTADALENMLKSLQEFKKGKIFIVFGCGGDRDRSKRSAMAAVCDKYADLSIVTSDNPRSEKPLSICQEIVKGFSSEERYTLEVDRRKAIALAIGMATAADMIVIAGKGHESYQIFDRQTISFSDQLVATELCAERHALEPQLQS